jgi:hypothetical protein
MCVELLELHRRVEVEMPRDSSTARYARVIELRSGADAAAVSNFMRRAEESFATWPVERPLTFRDIVLYVAVTNDLKSDIAVAGVRSRIVDFALGGPLARFASATPGMGQPNVSAHFCDPGLLPLDASAARAAAR